MGEAKRRGTRDERAAESIAYAEANRVCEERYKACRARQRAADLAAMPPKKREEVVKRQRTTMRNKTALLGLALGAAMCNSYGHDNPLPRNNDPLKRNKR